MAYYVLNVIQPDGPMPSREFLAPIEARVTQFDKEVREAGVWVFNGHLAPPSASTVVRVDGEDVLFTDGPYMESKEIVGGLMIIQVPDLDAALHWATKLSRATTLPTEVRAFPGVK